MKRRSPIGLALAVIAFQGTGLLHALHLAVEHAPGRCGHDHCHASHPAGQDLSPKRAGQFHADCHLTAHPGPHDHHHNPATCPVCQALAHLKAVSAAPPAELSAGLVPALQLSAAESFSLSPVALSTLGPRASFLLLSIC